MCVCVRAGGLRETANAQIWEQQGTGMSRGRRDVDKRRASIQEKRRGGEFLYGTVLERGVTSLFLATECERKERGTRGENGEGGREGM